MPTQEERITTLEKTVAWLQKKFDDADIQSVNHNTTMLLGLVYKQQADIKEIKTEVKGHTTRFDQLETRFDQLETRFDKVEAAMATKEDIALVRNDMATKEDIAAVRNDMATKEDIATIKKDMTTLEGRILNALNQLLTAINAQHP